MTSWLTHLTSPVATDDHGDGENFWVLSYRVA